MTSARRIPAPPPGRIDAERINETFARRMKYSLAKDRFHGHRLRRLPGARLRRARPVDGTLVPTRDSSYRSDAKRVYYLSLEFLMGRALLDNGGRDGGGRPVTRERPRVAFRQEVGTGNFFEFGHSADEIAAPRASGYRPRDLIDRDDELRRVIESLATGELARAHPGVFEPIVAELTGPDRYFLCADFRSYLDCQRRVAAAWLAPERWCRMSILNVAGMGRFSSDRSVLEYAREIWGAVPVEPPPAPD